MNAASRTIIPIHAAAARLTSAMQTLILMGGGIVIGVVVQWCSIFANSIASTLYNGISEIGHPPLRFVLADGFVASNPVFYWISGGIVLLLLRRQWRRFIAHRPVLSGSADSRFRAAHEVLRPVLIVAFSAFAGLVAFGLKCDLGSYGWPEGLREFTSLTLPSEDLPQVMFNSFVTALPHLILVALLVWWLVMPLWIQGTSPDLPQILAVSLAGLILPIFFFLSFVMHPTNSLLPSRAIGLAAVLGGIWFTRKRLGRGAQHA